VLYEGKSLLGDLGYQWSGPWTVWSVEVQNMHADLQAGTYYLEIYDVQTRWHTWAFWGESDGVGCTSPSCPSTAYASVGLPGMGAISEIGSEAFYILGTDH
jgi:hypothetical protein